MTSSTAAERWARQLSAWALPERVLKAVDHSPYAWPAKAFAHAAHVRPDPVTGPLLQQLLAPTGSLLDVGAGTGRLCLPPAERGHVVTAVEPNAAMAAELRRAAAACSGAVTVLEDRWPAAASVAGSHDVVLSANVVYDVAAIAPFLQALAASARRAVVIEATRRHPWDGLRRYFRTLHEVDLPDGPTVDDLVAVLDEALGVDPQRIDWESHTAMPFATQQDVVDFYAIRLCVPADRRSELAALLAPDIAQSDDGHYSLRATAGGMSTLHWDVT